METSTRDGADELLRGMEALSNPIRVAILHRLARPAFVPDLARELGMTRQALRKHLQVLEEAGLVAAEGQTRYGRLAPTPLLLDLLQEAPTPGDWL